MRSEAFAINHNTRAVSVTAITIWRFLPQSPVSVLWEVRGFSDNGEGGFAMKPALLVLAAPNVSQCRLWAIANRYRPNDLPLPNPQISGARATSYWRCYRLSLCNA